MNTFEKISAILDNEADVTELQEELIRDPKAAEKWQHYQRIGDVLRHEYQSTLDLDFTDQVMARLEEPLADKTPLNTIRVSENTQQTAANTNRSFWLANLGKMTSQVALSACAAVLTVLCVQFFPTTQAPLPTASGLGEMRPVMSYPAPVNLSIQEPTKPWSLESKPQTFQFDDSIDKAEHQEDENTAIADNNITEHH